MAIHIHCPQCHRRLEEVRHDCAHCGLALPPGVLSALSAAFGEAPPSAPMTVPSRMPAHVTQLPRVSPTQGPEPPPSPTRSSTLRPWLAATLSLVCGLGQLYNGQVPKGLILIILGMVALFSLQHPLGIIMVPLLWLYAIVDAYVVARRRG